MDQQSETARAPEADEFAIAASASLQERRFRTLKHGDAFGVFDHSGNVVPGPGSTMGLYYRDTRHLCRLELLLEGQPTMLLSSTLRDDNATLTCDLGNPDLTLADGTELEHDVVHVRRSRFLWRGLCHERIAVRNFGVAPLTLAIEIRFGADFADLFEVRGMRRARHGTQHAPALGPDGVVLSYTGLDQRQRTTRLRFCPAPDRLAEDRAVFTLRLPPRERRLIFLEIGCDEPEPARAPDAAFLSAMTEQRRWTRVQSSRATGIETSNSVFNEAMQRAISDLTMLVTEKRTGPYPYAGVPWFSTAFGRDALITALQVLWMDPGIARGVLRYLAENQATATDAASDAEPGKILHEVRHGEMAELREVPFRRYYGSIDSTPLFVMLAGAYLERTGDVPTLASLWPAILAAIGWIDTSGDRDGDGFVEYFRQTEEGLANQGWKDSFDSVSHADGSLATGPIALCEVQGYVYAARCAAAAIAERLGQGHVAVQQRRAAEALRERFEQAFWDEELGTYALALDGEKRPCRVRASNPGHLLLTGIVSAERAARVAAGMMSSRFFTGWGVRTLASGEVRFNPMSYHNGSVWPHDNAVIALGMARYGLKTEAARLLGGLFDASLYIDMRRLPELFCGFPRRRGEGPTFYPVACSPQAWASTAMPAMLGAALGLGFDPAGCSVVFDRPRLPEFLDEVVLHHLSLGEARISVALRRVGSEVAMNVLRRSGTIHAVLRS
jgi:glycogen debranching enzyme